jgi:hypothetical protein
LSSSIIRNCPNIQHLLLINNLHAIHSHCPPAFYDLITRCTQLRKVYIPLVLPVPIVNHLRDLPNLVSLEGIKIQTLSDARLFTTENGGFPNLHTFGFRSRSCAVSTSMIESMDCLFKSLRILLFFSQELPSTHSRMALVVTVRPHH